MANIHTVPEDAAQGVLNEQYQTARKDKGYIPNYVQVFSLHPEVYDAYNKLAATIRSRMRLRRYELTTFAAAMALGCTY